MAVLNKVRLKTLRRKPRIRILKITDDLLGLFKQAVKIQRQHPNEEVIIGHDVALGTFILYSQTKRRRY